MTNEEIETMEAGRAMDYLVADQVLQLSVLRDGSGILLPTDLQVRHYSTDIADAFEVVEHLLAGKFEGDFHLEHLNGEWGVSCCYIEGHCFDEFIKAPTAPLAICRAALKATLSLP